MIQVAARSFFGRSLGLTRNRSSRNPACCQSRVRNRRREIRRASSRGRETVSAASVGLENARARCPGRLPEGAAKAWAKPKARRHPQAQGPAAPSGNLPRHRARAFSSPTEAAKTVSRPRLEARRVSLLQILTRDWQHAGFLELRVRPRLRPKKLLAATCITPGFSSCPL